MNYAQFRKARVDFLAENSRKDHVFVCGKENSVVLSAPHGVSQTRLGKPKFCEPGSLCMALELQKRTNSALIAKTKNNFDDANFDVDCPYRKTLYAEIEKRDFRFVVDFHGLAKSRPVDINLGVNLGQNVKNNVQIFDKLESMLKNAGFSVSVDQPFYGGANTISNCVIKKFPKIWTIQIEINCSITNQRENFGRCKILLDTLENWINSL